MIMRGRLKLQVAGAWEATSDTVAEARSPAPAPEIRRERWCVHASSQMRLRD
jgi:hypothetical protein